MTIAAVNAIYQGSFAGGLANGPVAPTKTGEVLAEAFGGPQAQDLQGFGVAILDASATTFTLNWIDGTQTLQFPPSGVIAMRNDPPAWTAATNYQLNYIVLGSAHAQQVTVAGVSGASAPTWTTNGGTVTDGGVTWKDLGATQATTTSITTVTAITNTAATVTFSAAGTSLAALYFTFRIIH